MSLAGQGSIQRASSTGGARSSLRAPPGPRFRDASAGPPSSSVQTGVGRDPVQPGARRGPASKRASPARPAAGRPATRPLRRSRSRACGNSARATRRGARERSLRAGQRSSGLPSSLGRDVRAPLPLKTLVDLDGQKAVLYRSRMNPSRGRDFEARDPLARLADHTLRRTAQGRRLRHRFRRHPPDPRPSRPQSPGETTS